MKVLIACEESQRVCIEFRKLGHEAYSCDIQEPSGGHPEWHILDDAAEVIKGGFFVTMDRVIRKIDKWDLIIAHPVCTYLSNVANRSHSLKCTPLEKINDRTMQRIEAMRFFMAFINADCEKIAVENPIGLMNTCYRKPDQIIHPYMFAYSEEDKENYVTKATCLWLKGLPTLEANNLPKPENGSIFGYNPSGKAKCWEESIKKDRPKERSKTFPGIAKAMAEQWGK